MTADSAPAALKKNGAFYAIAAGGLIAGTLDLTQALFLFGRRVPLVIAAGLLGPSALQAGTATYILGVLLHFFIASSAAAVYYAASRRLGFPAGASAGVRLVFRDGGGSGNELYRAAALCAS